MFIFRFSLFSKLNFIFFIENRFGVIKSVKFINVSFFRDMHPISISSFDKINDLFLKQFFFKAKSFLKRLKEF